MLPSITKDLRKSSKAGSIQPLIPFWANPRYHVHIRKLEGGLKDMYRYRLGDLRVLYEIHEDMKTIRIKAIDVRGSVYK